MAGLGDNTAKRIEPDLGSEEPSMDEILASIRQIIADDEKPKAVAEDDRSLFTHPTDVSNNNAGVDFPHADLPTAAPPEVSAVEDAPLPMPPGNAVPLEAQLAAGMSAVLAQAAAPVSPQVAEPEVVPSLPVPTVDAEDVTEQVVQRWLADNADAVEATVTQVAQPVIRAWMAENLPGMVERLIREEIEFVSRGKPRS
ncbi:MAG: DUF2497 domain-containing protein [Pseudomonadota bacterium]